MDSQHSHLLVTHNLNNQVDYFQMKPIKKNSYWASVSTEPGTCDHEVGQDLVNHFAVLSHTTQNT